MIPLDQGILDDIIANPVRDDLRLVAADWWDDQGEHQRAEFVRLQIKIARIRKTEERNTNYNRGRGSALERLPLLKQEKDLLMTIGANGFRNGCAWSGILHSILPLDSEFVWSNRHRFHRGFVEEIICQCDNWLLHDIVILKSQPIRKVTLAGWTAGDNGDDVCHRHWTKYGRDLTGTLYSQIFKELWPTVEIVLPVPDHAFTG